MVENSVKHQSRPQTIFAIASYFKNFDWWTVGVLTYELAAGFPPFAGADEIEMFSLIQVYFKSSFGIIFI